MPLTSKEQAFREWKAGELHSGKGGPVVKNRRQAIAIALSVDRRAKGKRAKRATRSSALTR
jgi:hypothetical protein